MKNWIRNKIIELIGQDIDRIARDAYHEGCYVTARQMQAEKQLELQRILAHNEKLQEVLSDHMKICPQTTVITTHAEGFNAG